MAKISCYKISYKLSLKRLVQEFRLEGLRPGQGYVLLSSEILSDLLKTKCENGLMYLTNYGCICEIGLSEYDVNHVIKYIASICGNLDMNLFFNYYDFFEVDTMDKEINVNEFETYATIISKSVELRYLEAELDDISDRTDIIIKRFSEAKIDPTGKSYLPAFIKLMRLKLNSVGNTHILDRPDSTFDSHVLKEIYDNMNKELELEDRYENFSVKIQTLTRNITPYHHHGVSNRENRLLVFETFLIALFPLVSFIKHFIHN